MDEYDIVIAGGGMAGVSLAAALGGTQRVLLLEAELAAGTQATGRSAALYAPGYGTGPVRTLTVASGAALHARNDDGPPFLAAMRPTMLVATADQTELLEAQFAAAPSIFARVSGAEARRLVPILKGDAVVSALINAGSADIDVDALLQHNLRKARRGGVVIAFNEGISSLDCRDGGWEFVTPKRRIRARTLVNAAGAWAERIAGMAGLTPIGLQPKRRTAALVDAPAIQGFDAWPAVIDIAERFYFKPDAGRLLVSPAEETDVEPHDAYADDVALAEGIERIGAIADLIVKRAPKAWAGLRTFAPDRMPVAGFDRSAPAPFYWLAGQGGYGIQTAPALAAFAASQINATALPAFANEELARALSPQRFRT